MTSYTSTVGFATGLISSLPCLPAVMSTCTPTGGDACEYCPLFDPAPAGGYAINPLKPNKLVKEKMKPPPDLSVTQF
jgi:hypothetical protein